MYVQLVMINLFHKLLNAVVQADVFFFNGLHASATITGPELPVWLTEAIWIHIKVVVCA